MFCKKQTDCFIARLYDLDIKGAKLHSKSNNPDLRRHVYVLGSDNVEAADVPLLKKNIKEILDGQFILAGNKEDVQNLMLVYNNQYGRQGPPTLRSEKAVILVSTNSMTKLRSNLLLLRRSSPIVSKSNRDVQRREGDNVRLEASSKSKLEPGVVKDMKKAGIENIQAWAIEARLDGFFVDALNPLDVDQRLHLNDPIILRVN